MMRTALLIAAMLILALTAAPTSTMAQLVGTDTAPGSSCAGFLAGATRITADADQDGAKVTLICDGSIWNAERATAAAPDRGAQFNSGGSLFGSSRLVYTSAGDLIVGSLQIDDTGTGLEDSRMYFDVSNSAFRAGKVSANQWDFSSSGQYSAAFGLDTVASGFVSAAFGFGTVASGSYSMAVGLNSIASNSYSTAIGNNTKSSGFSSTAMGDTKKASNQGSTAMPGRSSAHTGLPVAASKIWMGWKQYAS